MWLFLLLVALIIFAIYYYRFYQITQNNKIEGDFYNQFTGQWEKAKIDSKGIDPSKVVKADSA